MTINMPLTAETKHKFNLETFRKMKKTAAVVNTGRGPLIKEDDLYVALKERIISAAAIDVTEEEPLPKDHKLFELNNLIVTPHAAFYTERLVRGDEEKSMPEEVIRVLNGEEPENRVNK